ncbi:MAG: hypothetical protein ACLQFR_06175 [Streptosporangiaceae bacterium]
MRDREMNRFEWQNPDLAERIKEWAGEHPDSSLEDAVRDLDLWPNPKDRDAQWFVLRYLPSNAAGPDAYRIEDSLIMPAMQQDGTAGPDVFQADQDRALAELELAWADDGYHGFGVDDGTWSAISSAGDVLTGDTPDALTRKIRAHWQAMQ